MDRHLYYQRQADYYGERATKAGQRYMETGLSLDKLWFGHFTRVHLRYVRLAQSASPAPPVDPFLANQPEVR